MAIKSFTAGADLTGKNGYAVKTSGVSKTVIVAANTNDECVGILFNDNTSGKQVSVALEGEYVFGKIGASGCSFGDDLYAAAGGTLIKAGGTGDEYIIAKAMSDGNANDLIKVVVNSFIK